MSCGKNVDSGSFYMGKNPKYKYWGNIPICKDCMLEMYNEFYQENPDHRIAVIKFCIAMDIPFADNIFNMAMNRFTKEKYPVPVGYMSFINSAVGKNKGKRFQDSEIFDRILGTGAEEDALRAENGIFQKEIKGLQEKYDGLFKEYNKTVTERERLLKEKNDLLGKVEKFGNISEKQPDIIIQADEQIDIKKEDIPEEYSFEWGEGFELKDYEYLEREIEVWKRTHKCDNEAEETLLKEICLTKLGLRKSRASNDDLRVKDLTKMLQDLMKTAALDPSKSNAASSGKLLDAFGVWVKDIEENRPAEWIEDKTLFKDVDDIGSYLKKYVVRPIKNFITGSRDFGVDTDLLSKD
jgi:hypothetical protein